MTTTTTALAKRADFRSRDLVAAFRRGDKAALIALLKGLHGARADMREPTPADVVALDGALEDLAQFALELRRENVAVIGDREAFVRRTPDGTELAQVLMPVRLSLHDDTLYQIPVFGKYVPGTNQRMQGDERGEWKAVVPAENARKASISAYGLNTINRVAGCSIVQPAVIIVDGNEKTNPYVERAPTTGGRPGDIVRIMVAVNVCGPSPATGNPVVIQYTLDVDPGKDLIHMLMTLGREDQSAAYLIDETAWEEERARLKGRAGQWKMIPLYGGVGLVHDLGNEAVRKAYQKHVNILQNSLKKAQTVARRNALRSHPALAYQTVEVDDKGVATVAVVGWASSGRSMASYVRMLDRIARGQSSEMPEVEVVNVEHNYEPEHDDVDAGDLRATVEEAAAPVDEEKNRLVEQIDKGLTLLTPAEAEGLAYEPTKLTAEELRAVLTRLNSIIDARS